MPSSLRVSPSTVRGCERRRAAGGDHGRPRVGSVPEPPRRSVERAARPRERVECRVAGLARRSGGLRSGGGRERGREPRGRARSRHTSLTASTQSDSTSPRPAESQQAAVTPIASAAGPARMRPTGQSAVAVIQSQAVTRASDSPGISRCRVASQTAMKRPIATPRSDPDGVEHRQTAAQRQRRRGAPRPWCRRARRRPSAGCGR